MRWVKALLLLSALAFAQGLKVEPESHDFGEVWLGRTSDPITVKVKNETGKKIVFGTVTVSGKHAPEFVVFNDECSYRIMDPGAECTLQVAFHPLIPSRQEVEKAKEKAKDRVISLSREARLVIPYGVFPSIEATERKTIELKGTLKARLKEEKK
ncbi:MAG: hypothetical protein GXO03_02560 [Aquificae bacterium]|nr:hypothetical protein [Aquificota bacterium]